MEGLELFGGGLFVLAASILYFRFVNKKCNEPDNGPDPPNDFYDSSLPYVIAYLVMFLGALMVGFGAFELIQKALPILLSI